MNLQFESIQELEDFLLFAARIGSAAAAADNPPRDYPTAPAAAAAQDEDGAPLAVRSGTEASKRKRRTKSEMEAARAAEVPVPDADHTPEQRAAALEAAIYVEIGETTHADGSVTTTSVGLPPDVLPSEVTAPAGNPFAAAPSMQAVLDAPNQGAATLAGLAAIQNTDTAPVLDVHARAAAILADSAQVESIAHLRACQSFIQQHGMPKYNESFRDGLNANIATYQPEQRALHLAILESLDA